MSQNALRQLTDHQHTANDSSPVVDNTIKSAIQVNSNSVPFSKMERFLVVAIGLCILTMMIALIFIRTSNAQSQRDIQDFATKTTKVTNKNSKLQQEINELSNSGRLLQIAQKRGFKLQDNNIRNISK
ncbi:cell division protein FtsL [Bombilactobacillus thymidiniphilus]|uniref:Cell division protein FtsL n=1 Tax=Bombilactobacillus thymidiniphilus TaxID=2923363 RepID=A0ABY4PE55_9LACO|nr:cell division protein FtsL [Bombilactobacillus thymidiniphilus]UQS83796.1 cell division protein FtsL [Bombilactobacillus thymidiniphilus]